MFEYTGNIVSVMKPKQCLYIIGKVSQVAN